ncbi:hypothetical protein EGM87_22820 [Sphingobium sp. RSMS]|uniref:hypothetical protein n=1 Tax=Sphingobium sp. RSMS TaxID=520734 RepID=UPI0010F652CB|nr:hypothetical protein [Sphingobium sp. RSMS]UXC93132.1 hypothetical protein EGM87_22820 [Sphingobium sp. RSMS]
MTEPGAIWGGIFSLYIMAGIFALSAASNGSKPKDVVPGSARLKQWEASDAKGDKLLKLWGAGFLLLLLAWWLLS